MRNVSGVSCAVLLAFYCRCRAGRRLPAPVGIFEGHGDVGTVLHPGRVRLRRSEANLHHQRQRREHVARRRTRSSSCGRRCPAM